MTIAPAALGHGAEADPVLDVLAAPRRAGRSHRRRGSCSRFAARRACSRRSSCCARPARPSARRPASRRSRRADWGTGPRRPRRRAAFGSPGPPAPRPASRAGPESCAASTTVGPPEPAGRRPAPERARLPPRRRPARRRTPGAAAQGRGGAAALRLDPLPEACRGRDVQAPRSAATAERWRSSAARSVARGGEPGLELRPLCAAAACRREGRQLARVRSSSSLCALISVHACSTRERRASGGSIPRARGINTGRTRPWACNQPKEFEMRTALKSKRGAFGPPRRWSWRSSPSSRRWADSATRR